MDQEKPFVFVAFNYRLGLFGFLSSNELVTEAQDLGETGYRSLGFHDQRLALQWVSDPALDMRSRHKLSNHLSRSKKISTILAAMRKT